VHFCVFFVYFSVKLQTAFPSFCLRETRVRTSLIFIWKYFQTLKCALWPHLQEFWRPHFGYLAHPSSWPIRIAHTRSRRDVPSYANWVRNNCKL